MSWKLSKSRSSAASASPPFFVLPSLFFFAHRVQLSYTTPYSLEGATCWNLQKKNLQHSSFHDPRLAGLNGLLHQHCFAEKRVCLRLPFAVYFFSAAWPISVWETASGSGEKVPCNPFFSSRTALRGPSVTKNIYYFGVKPFGIFFFGSFLQTLICCDSRGP